VSGGDHRWFKRSAGKKRPVPDDNTNNNNNEMGHGGNKFKCNYISAVVVFVVSVWSSGVGVGRGWPYLDLGQYKTNTAINTFRATVIVGGGGTQTPRHLCVGTNDCKGWPDCSMLFGTVENERLLAR